MLSSLYADWVDQLLDGPIPQETKATCEDCAMLPQPGMSNAVVHFHPETKCCTFQPPLVNYRVGLILSDDHPDSAPGRATVEQRMRTRVGVTPWGLHLSARFNRLYENRLNSFGRDPALLCPHHIEGRCSIWRHSPPSCTTWFCKHVRGASGWQFWNALGELLREVDKGMGLWCASELELDPALLWPLLQKAATDDTSEHDDQLLWGVWAGRETEFYRACAERVRRMDWNDVSRICGTKVNEFAKVVRERYATLTSPPELDRPLMGLIHIDAMVSGKQTVLTYSPYDPLRISPELFELIPLFDGRPIAEVLEQIRVQHGILLEPALLRRLADFKVLVELPRGSSPDPVK